MFSDWCGSNKISPFFSRKTGSSRWLQSVSQPCQLFYLLICRRIGLFVLFVHSNYIWVRHSASLCVLGRNCCSSPSSLLIEGRGNICKNTLSDWVRILLCKCYEEPPKGSVPMSNTQTGLAKSNLQHRVEGLQVSLGYYPKRSNCSYKKISEFFVFFSMAAVNFWQKCF